MTLRELRDELRARGESDEGTKGELERRLASSALVAAGHEAAAAGEVRGGQGSAMHASGSASRGASVGVPRAAAAPLRQDSGPGRARGRRRRARGASRSPQGEETAAAAAAIAAASKQGVQALLEPYDEAAHFVLRTEPAATVALLAGGSGSAGAGADALPAAQVALESARALADALQTAPLLGDAAWGPLGGAAAAAGAGDAAGRGVRVEVYWVEGESGCAWQVPLAALYSLQAHDLAAQLPAVSTGRLEPSDLAARLKASRAPALSLLPPGAAAAAAGAALAAAGVPVAGGGCGGLDGGRWGMLTKLQAAKFPTLPSLMLEAVDYGLAAGDAGNAGDGGKKRRTSKRSKSASADAAPAAPAAAADPRAAARAAAAAALEAAAAAAAADAAGAAAGAAGASDDEGAVPSSDAAEARGPASDPAVISVAQKLAAWCAEAGMDPDYQTFTLCAPDDAAGEPLATACGVERAAVAGKAVLVLGEGRAAHWGCERARGASRRAAERSGRGATSGAAWCPAIAPTPYQAPLCEAAAAPSPALALPSRAAVQAAYARWSWSRCTARWCGGRCWC